MRQTPKLLLPALLVAAFAILSQPLLAPADPMQGSPSDFDIPGVRGLPPITLAVPNPKLQPKPLKVWHCIAGWYGEEFDGKPTANGESYDMYGPTAASRDLPLGSVVKVVYPQTRRSVLVRINDRGPYVDGRGLDVSYGVARRLGFAKRGLARVKVELLEVPKRPAASHPGD